MINDVYFVLLDRYPTEKAYGVTTRHSLEALERLGYRVTLLSPDNSHFFSTKPQGIVLFQVLSRLRSLYQLPVLGKLSFFVHCYIWLVYCNSKLVPKKEVLVWSRNLLVPVILKQTRKHFCELHQLPSKHVMNLFRFSSNKNLTIGYISKELGRNLQSMKSISQPLIYTPMAVPDHFFQENFYDCQSESYQFTFGYFGSFQSSGNTQGVEKLLKEFTHMMGPDTNISLLLVGIGKTGKHYVETFLRENNLVEKGNKFIKVIEYIPHEQINEFMKIAKYLVIPYPESRFNSFRFPLKALEYAACCRSIICTRTTALTNIFDESQVWFYDCNNADSFKETFIYAESHDALRVQKKQLAYTLSTKFDYISRVKNVLEAINDS